MSKPNIDKMLIIRHTMYMVDVAQVGPEAIELQGIGQCEFTIPPVDEARNVRLLRLSQSGQEVASLFLSEVSEEGASRACMIEALEVEERFRGKGASSFLIRKAIEQASADDFEEIDAYVFNERILSAFCHNFDEERLRFFQRQDDSDELIATDREAAVNQIAEARRTQFPDNPQSSDMLRGKGVHIAAALS